MSKIKLKLPGGDGEKLIEVDVGSLAQEDTLRDLLKVMGAGGAASLNSKASQRAINDLGDAASASADALDELPTSFEDVSDAVEAAASNMRDASSKFKKDLGSSMFTNTKSLFSGMSSPMNFLKDSASDLGGGLKGLLTASSKSGGAMAGFSGGMLRMLGPIGLAASAVSAALGFLVGRVQKNIEMYDTSLKAGAVFAGGLEEFRDTVTTSSLNLDDFNAVASKNAASFAAFGGSVAAGAKKFAAVSGEVGKYGVQFKNLGYSQEEMGSVQAEYMEMLQRTNSLTGARGKSDAEVARGAMNYATNLKLISSLTGKSVEQLKAEQLARSKDFRIMIAAKAMAERRGIAEEDAMNMIQKNIAMAPEALESILSQATGRSSVAAAKQNAVFGARNAALQAMTEAEMQARAEGITDEGEINKRRMAAGQKYVAAMDKEQGLHSLAGSAALAAASDVNTAVTDVAQGLSGAQDFKKMLEGGPEAAAALAARQTDQTSIVAQQNAISTDLYNAQRKLLNMTDQLAIGGMKALQDAFLKFAIYLYDVIPGLGDMSPSLKAAADAFEAETIAADNKAKADKKAADAAAVQAKVTTMDPKSKDELARLSEDILSKGVVASVVERKLTKGKDETDEAFSARKKEEIRKGYLAQGGSGVQGQTGSALVSQLHALSKTEAGKGLSQEQLKVLLSDMYDKQGLVISENFQKVMEKPQAPTAPATEVPKAANGGILSGARSGFDAILHGTEAVVPLPDNKTIPVNLNIPDSVTSMMGGAAGSSDLVPTMSQVRDLLQMQNVLLSELIDHTRASVKVQKNIRDLNF